MPDLTLTEEQQRALRLLLAAEPVPGELLPAPRLLEQVAVLIPCRGIRLTITDRDGYLIEVLELPPSRAIRVADVVLVRLVQGAGLEVQLAVDRGGHALTEREQRVLRLLRPPLERLLRAPPTPHLPADLTVQERRVLQYVAAGRSNAEIGERMGIAACTVRKHLEHAFPKLGVTNRLAAAIAFAGPAPAEHRERVPAEMFA